MIAGRCDPIATAGRDIAHGDDNRQLLFSGLEQGETNFLAGEGRSAGRIHPDNQSLDLVFIQSLVNQLGNPSAGGHAGPGIAADNFAGNGDDANRGAIGIPRVCGNKVIIVDAFETVR